MRNIRIEVKKMGGIKINRAGTGCDGLTVSEIKQILGRNELQPEDKELIKSILRGMAEPTEVI